MQPKRQTLAAQILPQNARILSAIEAGSGKNGCSAEGNWLFTTGCEEGITRKVVSTEKSVGCSDESECSE